MKNAKPWLMYTALWMLLVFVTSLAHANPPSAAAVGWGNTFVPGLGATLLGEPAQGLLEASLEIGTYYGGTFFAQEGPFTIDGTVIVPNGDYVLKPLVGQILQEFGLKYHMYNTFYHYQQASLDPANQERDLKMLQPLYKGDWEDVLSAPFRWKNLSTFWVYVPVAASTLYLVWAYEHNTQTFPSTAQQSAAQDALYGATEAGVVPLGSAFGEETYFRGFMQREFTEYTGSPLASIIITTIPFTLLHPPSLRPAAALGGLYYGFLVNHFDGDLGLAIANHFWIDFVNGFINWVEFRKIEGKPPLWQFSATIPF